MRFTNTLTFDEDDELWTGPGRLYMLWPSMLRHRFVVREEAKRALVYVLAMNALM